MKGLTWYSRVIFSLFILTCIALLVMQVIYVSPQSLALMPVPILYIALTALCFPGVKSVTGQVKKRWIIYGLVWSLIVVLLPLILATLSSFSTALFMILTAGYEWFFIALATVFAICFIPVVVFFSIRLNKMGKSSK